MEKVLVGAFSVITKLQTSRRFVSSSITVSVVVSVPRHTRRHSRSWLVVSVLLASLCIIMLVTLG